MLCELSLQIAQHTDLQCKMAVFLPALAALDLWYVVDSNKLYCYGITDYDRIMSSWGRGGTDDVLSSGRTHFAFIGYPLYALTMPCCA